MRTLIVTVCVSVLAGCVTAPIDSRCVGTWRQSQHGPYLRIYSDGRAVCWPTPPDGGTAWTTFKNGVIDYHYQAPLHNPVLSRRGRLLVMKTNVGEQLFDRNPNDLEPPK